MLDVEGVVQIRVDGMEASLVASGTRLIFEIERSSARPNLGYWRGRLRTTGSFLAKAGLTAEVRRNSNTLLILGAGAQPGLLARILNLGPTSIPSLRGLFGLLLNGA